MKHGVIIRIVVFLGPFTVSAVVERMAPRLGLHHPVKARWITHFSITVISIMFLRLMSLTLPFLALKTALDAV